MTKKVGCASSTFVHNSIKLSTNRDSHDRKKTVVRVLPLLLLLATSFLCSTCSVLHLPEGGMEKISGVRVLQVGGYRRE